MKRKYFFISLISLFLLTFTSCSEKIMGYSVVLWNIPEAQIASGEIVPVYIKSNISHVYVIGTKSGEKIEVPLWQLSDPVKKRKVRSVAEKYEENAHTYASVKTDGLPCRAEAVNTSKQVYRLRKGEVIKILYKGVGQAPMTGNNALEGDWYRILTETGTAGWCFSYNLKLYEAGMDGKPVGGEKVAVAVEADPKWERIISKSWYPDYFKNMIETGNIDLSKIHPSYKFYFDAENKKVSLNTLKIHELWNYDGYTKTDESEYTLKNVPVKIIYRKSDFIVVRYTDDSGKPQDINFVTIDANISDLINKEKDRRSQEYMQIWSHGPVYASSNYGKITFNEDGVFQWTNFKLLVPSIIPAGTKGNGSASIKYSLGKKIAGSYDGVITFKFEGLSTDVNFFYKLEDGVLRLEDTTGASYNGSQITSRGTSPVNLYFRVKK